MSEWVSTFPGYSLLMSRFKTLVGQICKTGPVPRHVGVIMDGNRRFAKSKKIELKEGHNMGFEGLASMLELLYETGVEYATVYAFSIENFKRLKHEVDWLMELAKTKLLQMSQHGELCDKFGIRIRIIGNKALLPEDVRKILQETERATEANTRAVLNVCFPYTSRDEMMSAIKSTVKASIESPNYIIDEDSIQRFLFTADAPPLDILIRTSGTYRLSDFLLWQTVPSTCHIFFSNKLWPEFSTWDMTKILFKWSFNTYWYGQSAKREATATVTDAKNRDFYSSPSPSPDSGNSTAYERFNQSCDDASDSTFGSVGLRK